MAQRCTRYKRVRSKFGGTVRRCASYGGRSSNGRRRPGGRRRRRGGLPRGSSCVRYKRVRVRGQGIKRRCAKYRVRGGRRAAAAGRRAVSGRYRRGRRPFNKGKKCLMRKRVYSKRMGRYVVRCASYGAGRITRKDRMLGPGRAGTAIVVRRRGDDTFPGFFS